MSVDARTTSEGDHDDATDDVSKSRDDDTTWLPVDPRMVGAERLSGWLFFAVVMTAAVVISAVVSVLNWPPTFAIYCVWFGVLTCGAGLIWLVHFLPMLVYRNVRYRLGDLGFEIRRGIWWKRRITIPISRVQHTDVAQGPIQRRFGIGKIVVYTAGTQNASVELDGLNIDVANDLRDALVARSEAADGV